jgi:hypothetical protein
MQARKQVPPLMGLPKKPVAQTLQLAPVVTESHRQTPVVVSQSPWRLQGQGRHWPPLRGLPKKPRLHRLQEGPSVLSWHALHTPTPSGQKLWKLQRQSMLQAAPAQPIWQVHNPGAEQKPLPQEPTQTGVQE